MSFNSNHSKAKNLGFPKPRRQDILGILNENV